MINLPTAFEKRMKSLPDFDFEAYVEALNREPVKGFRVNTDKLSVEDFSKINIFGNEKIPFSDTGFYLTAEKVGSHPFHHAGMIYVQEPAAMAPIECLDINENWTVLDMCASPGGKSTQIRNKLADTSVLVSNEIIPSRCKILTGNIERTGAKNTVTTYMDTNRLAKAFPHTFDLIICDAPCSGEGMFRKESVAIDEWSENNVQMCAKRQAEILENAVKLLKKGGYIIYSTCTFSLEENEMLIDTFLSEHPDFELQKPTQRVIDCTSSGIAFDGCKTENIHYTRRFYPHISKGEGQFMSVLHHKELPEVYKKWTSPLPVCEDRRVFDFLDSVLCEYKRENIRMYNGNPVIFSSDFAIKNGMAFSCGITIGEIKKNYIQPHHQFFSAMGSQFKRKIELCNEHEKLKSYLKGEEIAVECENGWSVITINGCSLGGIKAVNGTAKNHYPKGLRNK